MNDNANATISRLEQLRASLEAARNSLADTAGYGDFMRVHARGMNDGLQVAIDSIDSEIRIIRAGARAANEVLQSNNANNEG